MPGSCLDMTSLGPAMLFSGVMPRDCYALVYVMNCPQPGHSFNFRTRHTAGYMGVFAPGGAIDAHAPAGCRHATLTLPIAEFHACLATHFPAAPEAVLALGAPLHIAPAEQARLGVILEAVSTRLTDPEAPLTDESSRRQLERDLRAAFFAAMRSGCAQAIPQPSLRVEHRHLRLRQARDYLAAHLHEPIYLADLCGATGLSRRALENLFNDFLGICPKVFLRHLRLHAARRAFQHAAPHPGVVKRVALEWGFWHLGHFAAEYRALFGESPMSSLTQGFHA